MADWDTALYRRLTRALRDLGITYCRLCNGAKGPIRYDVPPRRPLSFSVNHVTPRSRGGSVADLSNMEPAHYGCNSALGNRPALPDRHSRRW